MNREEIDKEVEEEFQKYLEKNRKNAPPPKKEIDWYKFYSILMMAIGILSTVYFLVRMITSK